MNPTDGYALQVRSLDGVEWYTIGNSTVNGYCDIKLKFLCGKEVNHRKVHNWGWEEFRLVAIRSRRVLYVLWQESVVNHIGFEGYS